MLKPIFYPTSDNKVVLAKPYRIDNKLVIPKGFVSDGATIPRVFWWFVPPFKPQYLPAVIVHDFLCDKEQYKLADIWFEHLLIKIEDSYKTRLMIRAVKLYHRFKYGVKV